MSIQGFRRPTKIAKSLYPTVSFPLLEPRNPSIEVSELNLSFPIDGSLRTKLQKGRSGIYTCPYNNFGIRKSITAPFSALLLRTWHWYKWVYDQADSRD